MKKKKVCKICIVVVAVLVALIMLFLGTRFAYVMMLRNNPAKYLKYEENADGTLTVIGFKHEWLCGIKEFEIDRELIIPEEVNGKPVTELEAVTSRVRITNIDIPNSITTIGHSAFAGITDSELRIPNSVTSIGEGLLLNENIIRVWIPNSVTNIGSHGASHWHAEEVTIFTTQGSYAEEWAKSYELHVEYCDEEA